MALRARTAAAGLLATLLLVVGAGCKDPSAVPRQSALERRDVAVTVGADGVIQVQDRVTFVDDAGGLVGVATRHPLEPVRDLTVDGRPVAAGQGASLAFGGTELRIDARTATIGYAVDGAVQAYADLTVAAVALHASASDASRQDPEVEVRVTVTLPPGAAGGEVLPHWQNGLHQEVVVDGASVVLDGTVPAWTGSSLVIGFAPGTVVLPDLGPGRSLVHAEPHRDAFEAQQASIDEGTRSLEATLDDQARLAGLTRPLFLGVAGFVLLLMVVSARRGTRDERRRRAALDDDVPDELREPPGTDSPAVVALLVAKGERVSRGGVAGAVLRLAERRALSIEGITSEEFVLRVVEPRPSVSDADAVLLDAVAAEVGRRGADGALRGPPLWRGDSPRFGTAYRRAVLKEARAAGLLARTHSPMTFGLYASMFAFCTWPLWLDQSLVFLLPVASVASMIFAFPFVARLSITDEGVRQRSRWLAFRRFLRREGQLQHVGAPGLSVWGPFLAYGAALGVAPTATDALAPPDADGEVQVRADTSA